MGHVYNDQCAVGGHSNEYFIVVAAHTCAGPVGLEDPAGEALAGGEVSLLLAGAAVQIIVKRLWIRPVVRNLRRETTL